MFCVTSRAIQSVLVSKIVSIFRRRGKTRGIEDTFKVFWHFELMSIWGSDDGDKRDDRSSGVFSRQRQTIAILVWTTSDRYSGAFSRQTYNFF